LFFAKQCKTLLDTTSEACNLLFDLTDFGLSNMDYGLVSTLLKVFTEYYPEILDIVLVVNSPWIFSACWNIIKRLMDEETASAIIFINREQIYEYIDISQLPEEYGGTKRINYGLGNDIVI